MATVLTTGEIAAPRTDRKEHRSRAILRYAAWCFVACSSAGPARKLPARPDVTAALLDAIERGDLEHSQRALCDGYRERGMECAEPLGLELLAPSDVMSRYSDLVTVKMQPMPPPGGGFAYWDNWSALLSNGAWNARALFADDDEARRIANMLLVTVQAHELGHHLASVYGCVQAGPRNELLADVISVPLIRELATGRLGELHAKLRAVADAMIAQVPAEVRVTVPEGVDLEVWVGQQAVLPSDKRAYAGLHLSRQRALLATRPVFASGVAACVRPHEASLAGRRLIDSQVVTERRVAGGYQARAAIDPAGRIYVTRALMVDPIIEISSIEGGPPLRIPLAEATNVDQFAALSPTRFAVVDTTTLIEIDASTSPATVKTTPLGEPLPSSLSYGSDGVLYGVVREDTTWRIFDVHTKRARWSGTLAGREVRDGSLATATLQPIQFAIDGDRLLTTDGTTVRVLEHGQLATLAGGLLGRRDGDSATAKLFNVVALRGLADGSVRIVEEDGPDHYVIRAIKR